MLRPQQNKQKILSKNKNLAQLTNKPQVSGQQLQTPLEPTHPILKHRKSNSSIQSNRLQRRSNSGKLKRYKQSKFDLSQVYIKKPLVEQFNQSLNQSKIQETTNQSIKQNSHFRNNKFQRSNNSKQELKNRRPLTPHKSQQQLKYNICKQKKINNQKQILYNQLLNQKQIQIALIQEKITKIEQENKNLKASVIKSGNQNNLLVNDNHTLKRKINQLEKELKGKSLKLGQVQNLLLQNENNLSQAKSKLQKLKKVIKENRITELEQENKKFQQKIQQLSTENQKIKKQCSNLLIIQQKLNQQINGANLKIAKFQGNHITKQKSYFIQSMKQQYLNRQIAQLRDKLNLPKDEKQKLLQQTIESLRIQLFVAQTKIQKQQIKIDCLSRKQEKSLQYVRKQKQKQYTHLKQRFRKFLLEYQKFRKQYNDLKIQNTLLKRQKTRRYSEQQFSYELTPQKR